VEVQVRQFEAAADDAAVAREGALDLRWSGLGRDVVVLRCQPEQQVADAAADQIRFEAAVDQSRRGADGIDIEKGQVDAGGR
jgi:hypothetical protein